MSHNQNHEPESLPRARVNRRRLIQASGVAAAGLVVAPEAFTPPPAEAAGETDFASRWSACHDRVWLGPEYWANPQQDWRIAGGRIECVNAAPDRNVHLLTRQLGGKPGDLHLSVRVGRVGSGRWGQGKGSAGFRIGIQGPLREYRNSLVFGTGLDAGVTGEGGLFIGEWESAKPGAIPTDLTSLELRLTAETRGGAYTLTLAVHDPVSGELLSQVRQAGVPGDRLVGNVALVANFGRPPGPANRRPGAAVAITPGVGQFWFADWRLRGSKLEAHEDHAFGPILFSQYTLSNRILKLTAQMPPVGVQESQVVRLQVRPRSSGRWKTLGKETIHPQARTVSFHVKRWGARKDVPYRLVYTQVYADGRSEEHFWSGTIRRDPVDQPVLTVADISCNIHQAFPNAPYVANLAKLNPDLIAFTGDQFYESTGGYGVVRTPLEPAILDYLRKWYIHGWTWRELTRDRPSVSIPDDHDVYQGNIWGESGEGKRRTQAMGGYEMYPEWINVVHRTQTSHHPDPHDPTPIRQGISVYHGPMTYGRVSFALLADRMFKSGPEGKVPPTPGRGDHVLDPNFDPKTADVPGAELLGERQMRFLREWVADWRGADMKAVISQTIFSAMATTHGGERQVLRADYDANGWPQTPRNEAVRLIRKAFAVHLAGDQHLPAVVQYGVETHRDGPVAFAGPAVNVGYPRWWEPKVPGQNRAPGAPEITGDFLDHFGNPMTVIAVRNGAVQPRRPVMEMMEDKASGLGIVRFDKPNRKITIECWPFLADPTQPGTQFPGWPVTVDMLDNYGRAPAAWLPTIKVNGMRDPIVEVIDEADGELVYALRIRGTEFRPHVFREGVYTLRVGEQPGGMKARKGIKASREKDDRTLKIDLG